MCDTVLQLITKYCNHLNEITMHFKVISDQTIKQFGIKCGQKLTKIEIYDYL
jgi:hypothetical protein